MVVPWTSTGSSSPSADKPAVVRRSAYVFPSISADTSGHRTSGIDRWGVPWDSSQGEETGLTVRWSYPVITAPHPSPSIPNTSSWEIKLRLVTRASFTGLHVSSSPLALSNCLWLGTRDRKILWILSFRTVSVPQETARVTTTPEDVMWKRKRTNLEGRRRVFGLGRMVLVSSEGGVVQRRQKDGLDRPHPVLPS